MNHIRYFQSYSGYFWQWEEGGEVLAIPNSNTLAYRDFILSVLRKLSPQGLPPFGSLLLAIAATNHNGSADLDIIYSILSRSDAKPGNADVNAAISFLKLLADLPAKYKEGERRLLLLQTIFEGCHNILSISHSKSIVSNFASDLQIGDKLREKAILTKYLVDHEIRTITLLERKFPNAEVILKRMVAFVDLDEEPVPELQVTALIEKPQLFFEELLNEQQTYSIATLIHHLWGALSIPFHSSLPSEQPIGGISDLTNKGDFDKLLISEFANDDIVLLSRLANNEALYLNREIPPKNNQFKRVLLIDVSLKSWGTPKTIAYALMLAIAKHPKTDMECISYAVGDDFYPVSFGSVHELIESTRILDGCLSPIKGMQRFIEEFSNKGRQEVFFISSFDSQRSAQMQSLMSDHHDFFSYWITTTQEGSVSLYKRQGKNRKHVQNFQLPLQQLWRTVAPVKQQNRYFATLPMLVRSPQNAKTLITEDGTIFQITPEKKVFRFFDKWSKKHERGWEVLAEDLPFAPNNIEIGYTTDKEYILLLFRAQDKTIFILNLTTGAPCSSKFDQFKSSQNNFIFHNDRFYYISSENSWTIDLNAGVQKNMMFPKFILDKDKERKKTLADLSQKMAYFSGILKNVNKVFINQTNNLVFNTHELHINNGGVIKLDKSEFLDVKIEASKSTRNKFIFRDGSSVEIKRSGMFILKSSNVKIPQIYIPAVLDANLGIATKDAFSGNEYFYKEQKANITLTAVGPEPLKIIKLINTFGNIGLKDTKALVDNVPALLFENMVLTRANDLKRALERAGGTAMIEVHNDIPHMEKLTPKTFFYRYIDGFIETIQNGTENKAM